MKHILAAEGRGALERFARGGLLIAFDFDGTLAPLVANPAHALMRGTTRRLLGAAARRYPCALLSGRARGDLLRRLWGLDLAAVVGNHGSEWGDGMAAERPFRAAVASWRSILDDRLRRMPGVVIEDKGLSLAIHFRQAPEPEAAKDVIHRAITGLDSSRIVGGKSVVNVLHAAAPGKGEALGRLLDRCGSRAAIYVGDDETDEEVFARCGERCLGIRVEPSPCSSARYYLQRQEEVDELLSLLLSLPDGGAREPTPGSAK